MDAIGHVGECRIDFIDGLKFGERGDPVSLLDGRHAALILLAQRHDRCCGREGLGGVRVGYGLIRQSVTGGHRLSFPQSDGRACSSGRVGHCRRLPCQPYLLSLT